jgi:hypothetical protein
VPDQAVPDVLQEPAAAYFFDASDQGPPLGTAGGSLGSNRQQLPSRWAPAAGSQPSRLRPAYTPIIPEPLPQLNPGAPGQGFAGLPGGPYALDALFHDPQQGIFPGPPALGLRGELPLGQPGPGPVGQDPAEPSAAAAAAVPPGIIYGVDGQWIRLRPGVNPAPPHSPPPAGRGRGRGSPP